MPKQTSTRSKAPDGSAGETQKPRTEKTRSKSSPKSSSPGAPKTETSLNQARPSNQKPGIHQRTAAKRETTRESRSAQSKLTSTGSPSAEAAGSASEEAEGTRDQLYVRAAALGINGRSRMTKAGLMAAIKEHGG